MGCIVLEIIDSELKNNNIQIYFTQQIPAQTVATVYQLPASEDRRSEWINVGCYFSVNFVA